MKQEAFEAAHEETWATFERWLAKLGGKPVTDKGVAASRAKIGREFPAMYREICHHLALARARRYSIALEQRLHLLALDGHQYLYRKRLPFLSAIGEFFAAGFPRAIRQRWRYMLVATLVFYLPAVGMAIALQFEPELIYSLLDPQDVSGIEEMYDPANDVLGRERQSDTDLLMFGYYIYNNISIGFQTFAGGLLFGIGSLFYLGFNGLYLGAIATHLTMVEFTGTFWPFVAGHSAFELTAITIFGGVGLMIGHGGIAPGRKKRWHAVRDQAVAGLPIIYGGTTMLILAAFIEAFWSSTTWPPVELKYAVGIALWVLLGLYFALMGRNEPR